MATEADKKSENKKVSGLMNNTNALKIGLYTAFRIEEDKKSKSFLRKCRAFILEAAILSCLE